ncbi:hypothetical protein L6R49_12490 [Myxococcota bacterium]|nr:hypothetical protein [Myxococcota bacterium]
MTLPLLQWWPLLAGPLLIAAVAPRDAGAAAPWRTGPELARATLCGALVAGLSGLWLVRFTYPVKPWMASDFYEYCATVGAVRDHTTGLISAQRSVFTALPSAWLSEHLGLVDGMGVAAILSMFVLGLSLYLWGRALGGVSAGLLTALVGPAFPPLVALSRNLSFYPESTAIFTFGAACGALALRYRTAPAIAAGAIGAGLCFLVDPRGLFFGLPVLCATLLAALWNHPRRWPLNLAIFAGLTAFAWFLGKWAYANAHSLEGTMDLRMRIQDRGLNTEALRPPFMAYNQYIWGRSDPLGIPNTVRWTLEESLAVPKTTIDEQTLRNIKNMLTPWLDGLLALGAVTLLGLTRGPERLARLFALIAGVVPFAAALSGAITVQFARPHYLANALPFFPLLVGLGVGTLMSLPSPIFGAAPAEGPRAWVRPIAAFILGLVLTLGGVPSPLSPTAEWREPFPQADDDIRSAVRQASAGTAGELDAMRAGCVTALMADIDAGRPVGGALFGSVAP